MKKFILILGICLWSCFSIAEEVLSSPQKYNKNDIRSISRNKEKYDIKDFEKITNTVEKFKNILKTNNPELVAQNVVYPFVFSDNCAPIQNEQEFIEKYDIIYTPKLLSQILSSDINMWHSDSQYDGIFYDDPYIHISLNGRLVDIDYTLERSKYNERCILEEQNKIYPNIKKYIKNLYILKTSKFIYRIDLTAVGNVLEQNKYRLSIWNITKKFSEKPLKIIEKGKLKVYGSANNEKFIFKNDNKSYVLQINTARASQTPSAEIIVITEDNIQRLSAEILINNPNLY